jgi:acyl-CoA synthetase (AMP-forming)/AMP-acid ligase II
MTSDSTYLWILPMFHACGWTFPWTCTFAFATQITLRAVDNALIWKHLLYSGVTHYCGAPTVQIGLVNDPAARTLEGPREVVAIIAGSAPTAHLLSQLRAKRINPVHVYGLTETYGPFMRAYPQRAWAELGPEEYARRMARVGFPFATALESRVVRRTEENTNGATELKDVPRDGTTVGEIVTRGNITMKEVCSFLFASFYLERLTDESSTSATRRRRPRRFVAAISTRVIWQLYTQTGRLRLSIAKRT